MSKRDRYYASPIGSVPDFSFNEAVVQVFDDMIERSVPGYASVIALTGQLAGRFTAAGDTAYDLGCSTGASLLSMRQHLPQNARLIGIDSSAPMIEQCRTNLAQHASGCDVSLIEGDVADVAFELAAFFALNFTLQFIPLAHRADLITRIAHATRPGGALVLSEKIRFDDASQQQLHTDMHHEFKRRQGYTDLEISQKRTALENIMHPETLDTHRSRLLDAGYRSCEVWFQCFNFMSLVAIR